MFSLKIRFTGAPAFLFSRCSHIFLKKFKFLEENSAQLQKFRSLLLNSILWGKGFLNMELEFSKGYF